MRSTHLSGVMPALVDDKRGQPRLTCGLSAKKTWMTGTTSAAQPIDYCCGVDGQDAGGLRKGNRSAAEAAVLHQKIEA